MEPMPLSRALRRKLDALSDEFDKLLERMQTPASRAAMKSAFKATPGRFGRAAVQAAHKRG